MLWFGTVQHFQWVPSPRPGIRRRRVHSTSVGTLDRGGAYASRSTAGHLEWEFDFPVQEAHGLEGLDVFQEYATGLWNDYAAVIDGPNPNDLIWWADAMAFRSNLFPPQWAAPMLSLGDWPGIGTFQSVVATPSNAFRHPSRSVQFTVTHAANTLPAEAGRRVVIPIPPGYTLRWGWSGSRTGTGVVLAQGRRKDGGTPLVQAATPLAVASSTRLSHAINGDEHDYATFGLSRTSTAASSVTVSSMIAQLHPNAEAPAVTGSHVAGQGATGCLFLGDALPEEYVNVDNPRHHFKGLSFGLIEVGAWL